MKNHKVWMVAGGILVVLLLLAAGIRWVIADNSSASLTLTGTDYDPIPITEEDFTNAFPIFSPSTQADLFVDCVDNLYFPLIPGTIYHFEEQNDEGLETITITVTNEKREILGIQATVVRDTVQLDEEVIEDTLDWYAQDDRGNVWYLGEYTEEYEDGEVVSTEGSWEAGVEGAVPGIIMLGDPHPGDLYFQEYWEDEAEDMGAVMSLSERVRVPYGSFENTLQTADYNPLDDQLENKWYAPGVGVVKEMVVDGSGIAELVTVTHDRDQIILDSSCGKRRGVAFVGTIFVNGKVDNLERLARISPQEAEMAVLSVIENAQIRKTELAVQSGLLVYNVTLVNGGQLIVDAGDGAVLDQ